MNWNKRIMLCYKLISIYIYKLTFFKKSMHCIFKMKKWYFKNWKVVFKHETFYVIYIIDLTKSNFHFQIKFSRKSSNRKFWKNILYILYFKGRINSYFYHFLSFFLIVNIFFIPRNKNNYIYIITRIFYGECNM